ncbi:MAG TPA: DUF2604 domain-containing protein [Candidatus Methylacidiphilales bacterium]|nr:DUF2604 domain-containing protein [Candidatus Methylacidiphilales bacterium]
MRTEIEIYVYTEEAADPKLFKIDPDISVEELLKIISPDRHHELCLTLSGEDAPKVRNHRLKDCGLHNGRHVHCHPHGKTGHHRHEHHVEVIVNGKPVHVKYVPQEHGMLLVERALEKSHNSGQKPENWQLRDEKGTTLDQSKPVRDYKLTECSKLFLNLKAGGGGAIG